MGFLEFLGLFFIMLKLTGNIDWPWAIVTLPLWIGFVVTAVVIVYYSVRIKRRK